MENKEKVKWNRFININAFWWLMAVGVIGLYFLLYTFKEPIVQTEILEFNNFLPWILKPGDSFFKALIERPFNLDITEWGYYRPRWLAFVVQFLDENLFVKIVRAFPAFGNRLPFYYLAMVLNFLALTKFVKVCKKSIATGGAAFIGSSVLFLSGYQVTTWLRARSAKLLALAVCIFLISWTIENINSVANKNEWYKYSIKAIIFFPLFTLDEQVLAVAAIMLTLSIAISVVNRTANKPAVTLLPALSIYVTYHLWWGKQLFIHFTPTYNGKHGHAIDSAFENIGFEHIKNTFSLIRGIIPQITVGYAGIYIVILLIALYYIFRSREIDKILTALCLICSPFALMLILYCAHVAIYDTVCLRNSVYTMTVQTILYMALIFCVLNIEVAYKKLIYSAGCILVMFNIIYNVENIDDKYYMNYLTISGGFMETVIDMEIGKDNINLQLITAENMEFDNDMFSASIHTPFTSNDFMTAWKEQGNVQENEQYSEIGTEVTYYLNTQKNRKLLLDARLEDWELYDYVKITVNKKTYDKIEITSENINILLDVMTERYRAAKVNVVFHKKDASIDGTIYLRKLQME